MTITIQTGEVARCTVPECAYNRAAHCYARAITVGNGDQPLCDTFHSSNEHVPRQSQVAGVGACKVYACRYNDRYQCTAERIYVGYDEAAHYLGCLTFSRA